MITTYRSSKKKKKKKKKKERMQIKKYANTFNKTPPLSMLQVLKSRTLTFQKNLFYLRQ